MAQSQRSSMATTTCSGPSQTKPSLTREERSGSGSTSKFRLSQVKPSGEREVAVKSDAPPAPCLRRSTRHTNSTLSTANRSRGQANVAEKNSPLEAVKKAKKRRRVDGAMNEANAVVGALRNDVQDAVVEEEGSREYAKMKAMAKATSSTTRSRISLLKASLAVGAPATNVMTQLKKVDTTLKNGQKENMPTSTKETAPNGKGKRKVKLLPPHDTDSAEIERGSEEELDEHDYCPPPHKKHRVDHVLDSGETFNTEPPFDDFNVAVAFLTFRAAYLKYTDMAPRRYNSTSTPAAASAPLQATPHSARSTEELDTANVLLDLSTNHRVYLG